MFLSGPAVIAIPRLIRFSCIQITLQHFTNMCMYIYLCVVQCNGVKVSPLSEIRLQSINHFHHVPTPPVSKLLYSFLSQSIRHHLPENGAQLLQYFKLQPQSSLLYVFKPCVHARTFAATHRNFPAAPLSLTCSKLSVKSAHFNIPDAFPSHPPVLLFMYQLTP